VLDGVPLALMADDWMLVLERPPLWVSASTLALIEDETPDVLADPLLLESPELELDSTLESAELVTLLAALTALYVSECVDTAGGAADLGFTDDDDSLSAPEGVLASTEALLVSMTDDETDSF